MKKLDYKDLAVKLNQLRKDLRGAYLTIDELQKQLKSYDIPSHRAFVYKLKDRCMVGDKKYKFQSTPIYYGTIEQIYSDICKETHSYHKLQQEKAKEYQYITYLKSLGYKIYKQETVEV